VIRSDLFITFSTHIGLCFSVTMGCKEAYIEGWPIYQTISHDSHSQADV